MSRALKQDDVLELSKLYETEFNQPGLHDRVLIFDVVASWSNVSDADENETREDCSQNEDGNGAETTEIANEETNINSRDAHPSLNDEKQSENSSEIFSEGNEATSLPTNKEQMVRQHKFYVHSTWLAVQSSYFRSLFYSGMKESHVKEVHVQISASEEQAHSMLLEAMYKIDVLDKADLDELLDVLKLADKYDVAFVFKKCKYCLQTMVASLEVCEKIMNFIKVDNTITDVEDLASTLQSFLAKEFSPLDKTWQTTSFIKLCKHSLRYLLSSDELLAESENTIFHALMHWIKRRGMTEGMASMLSVVRFELIPIDYLYNIVQHHFIAKMLPNFKRHYLRGISYHGLSDSMKKRVPCPTGRRKPSTDLFPVYTWVIPSDQLDRLVGTDQQFRSDAFWYCGYKMYLVITDVVNVIRNERFTAMLCFYIANVIEQSDVQIKWQAASQSFISTPKEQTYTFVGKPLMSPVRLKYRLEEKTQSPIATSLLSGSFSTGSSSKQECTKSCLSIDVKVKLI